MLRKPEHNYMTDNADNERTMQIHLERNQITFCVDEGVNWKMNDENTHI